MSVEKVMILSVFVLVNLTMFMLLPAFLYCLARYAPFRAKVWQMISDGDDVGHQSDAKQTVMLFFGGVSTWVLINLLLIDLWSDRDFLPLIGTNIAATGALYGFAKFGK